MAHRRNKWNKEQETEATWSPIPKGYKSPTTIPECPNGVEEIEWIAAETIGFFNSLTLLSGVALSTLKKEFTEPGTGFPDGFTFLWVDEAKKKSISLSSPKYISTCLKWMDSQFTNPRIFPTDANIPFPSEFIELYICKIFTMMFRIFAIIHSNAYITIKERDLTGVFNSTLKHFVFFGIRHSLLVETGEFLALRGPMRRLQDEYINLVSPSANT